MIKYIHIILTNLLLISIMVFSACCAKPLSPNTPLSMSDDDIINQGEEAALYVLTLCLNLDACEDKRIKRFKEEIIKNYPDWNEKTKVAIFTGEIFLGMTKKQAMVSWGEPKRIIKTVTEGHVLERMIYGNDQHLYFTDEILTAVKTNNE